MNNGLDLLFWARLAAAWRQTLSKEATVTIRRTVVGSITDNVATLKSAGTFGRIPSALEAIMSDEEDDSWQ